eukprot:scaffold14652_cov30-Prasinocladus_malaysianus.AAC.4
MRFVFVSLESAVPYERSLLSTCAFVPLAFSCQNNNQLSMTELSGVMYPADKKAGRQPAPPGPCRCRGSEPLPQNAKLTRRALALQPEPGRAQPERCALPFIVFDDSDSNC